MGPFSNPTTSWTTSVPDDFDAPLPDDAVDSFDRRLDAQARVEQLTILTADSAVAAYPWRPT